MSRLIDSSERRSVLGRVTATFGSIGLFGVLDFLAAVFRGPLTFVRILSLVTAMLSCLVAAMAWRESHQAAHESDDQRDPSLGQEGIASAYRRGA